MSVAAVAAVVGLIASGVTASVIVLLHFVEPEYDPSWRMISEYSLGRHGWLMRVAFIAMAIASAAMCVALWPFGGGWTIGLALVGGGGDRRSLRRCRSDHDSARRGHLGMGRAHSVLGGILLVGTPHRRDCGRSRGSR